MPPSHSFDFRPTETQDKKTAILSVISFFEAHKQSFNRTKLSEYFGVNERTTRAWCAAAASGSFPVSTYASAPATQSSSTPSKAEPQGVKRERSEDVMADTTPSSAVKSTPTKKKNPAAAAASRQPSSGHTSGPSQKKRKANETTIVNGGSPSPPAQLLTPPRRKTAQPQKRRRQMTESSVDFGFENSDEYCDV